MKTAVLATVASGLLAAALPAKRQSSGPTDTQILQYALTLENLENNFYSSALQQFDAGAFEGAGYPNWVRNRIAQISAHEGAHVSLLSGALGNMSVAECTYNFPYTDPKSFVSLAALIENVGVSAYAGAAQYISDKTYLTLAAVILSTEARHQAWENSAVLKESAWSGAYDTAIPDLNMVYTIASAFITSCPSSNPALPVMAYPALTVSSPAAGQSSTFTFSGNSTGTNYAIFYNGIGTQAVALDSSNSATIPAGLQGISYVVVSSSSTAAGVTASNVVAGPAILDFPFLAEAQNPVFSGM